MGTADPVRDVEDKIPGLRFRLLHSERTHKTGVVRLQCEVNDIAMWNTAVEKLDGLKLFSTLDSEVRDALGDALVETRDEVEQLKIEMNNLRVENQRYRKLLAAIGEDLGLP